MLTSPVFTISFVADVFVFDEEGLPKKVEVSQLQVIGDGARIQKKALVGHLAIRTAIIATECRNRRKHGGLES